MEVSLFRELKYFCNNSEEARRILFDLGAKLTDTLIQKDYIFQLKNSGTGELTKRIKLRYENDSPKCIYIYDRKDQHEEQRVVYQYFEVKDDQFLNVFTELYSKLVIVEKEREEWHLHNYIFHIDNVKGIGQIFEIEVTEKIDKYWESLKSYYDLFKPILGLEIKGSNEDYIQ